MAPVTLEIPVPAVEQVQQFWAVGATALALLGLAVWGKVERNGPGRTERAAHAAGRVMGSSPALVGYALGLAFGWTKVLGMEADDAGTKWWGVGGLSAASLFVGLPTVGTLVERWFGVKVGGRSAAEEEDRIQTEVGTLLEAYVTYLHLDGQDSRRAAALVADRAAAKDPVAVRFVQLAPTARKLWEVVQSAAKRSA